MAHMSQAMRNDTMRTHKLAQPIPGAQAAYLANGLVGLRIAQIPLPQGTALVNGYVGLAPEVGHSQYAPAPYPVGADLAVGGVWLSEQRHRAVFVSQEYDFACGELRSVFTYAGADATATVEVLTFCSRTQPTLALQEVAVTVDRPCALTLQAHLDQRGLPGALGDRCMPAKHVDGILRWEGLGGLSSVGAAYASEFIGEDLERRRRNDYGHEKDMELTQYSVSARPGRRYVMRQIGSLVPSRMHSEPHWQANRQVATALWWGFDGLRERNRAAWAELWRGCPRIAGAGRQWQDCVDAAFFYLHSSVHPSSPCSVAPFGLSRNDAYGGHVFWDTETFMFPPVLLTAPEAARAMLDYRSEMLAAARANARLHGYRGVQFPWQSGNTGSEVASFWCQGQDEHHINMDVAFAFAQYAYATGDEEFLRAQAWPVLKGVAEWIVSRVEKTARGYELLHVVGIDEMLENVDNNAVTNMLAVLILREAAAFADRVGVRAPGIWQTVADRLFVPIDPKTNVILKHDHFSHTGGICCPDPLVAYFPFGCRHSPEVDAATVGHYMELAEGYMGMPMLSALIGVFAARAGNRPLALEFFEKGIRAHLQEPFLQFNETASISKGPFGFNGRTVFVTNPAGFLMSLLYGLTGLQLDAGDPQGWAKHPIILPEGWEAIEVERLWARGEPFRLVARHGAASAILTPWDPGRTRPGSVSRRKRRKRGA